MKPGDDHDPCLAPAIEARALGQLDKALHHLSVCISPSPAALLEKASLLHQLGQASMPVWRLAFDEAVSQGADRLAGRAALALAQILLKHGETRQARETLARLERSAVLIPPDLEEWRQYVEALLLRDEGRVDEASERLGNLVREASGQVSVSALVARANLWGRTGRAQRAYRSLRDSVALREDLTPALAAGLSHAAAWHGVLALEDEIGRGFSPDLSRLQKVEELLRDAEIAFTHLGEPTRAAAIRLDRDWLRSSQGLTSTTSVPESSLRLRERGYHLLLDSSPIAARPGRRSAIRRWLKTHGRVDDDLAVRAELLLAEAGDPKVAYSAWLRLGELTLTRGLLHGWSDVLGRHAPLVERFLVKEAEQGRLAEAFGLAALWTGAPFRRLRARACIAAKGETLTADRDLYWRLRQREWRTASRMQELSLTGLQAEREVAAKHRRKIEQLLRRLTRTCSPHQERSWQAVVQDPSAWTRRLQASLGPEDVITLDVAETRFIVARSSIRWASGRPRPFTSGRIYQVFPSGRKPPPTAATHVWRIPDPSILLDRTPKDCPGAPVIIADPERNLPGARRAGRRLSESFPEALYIEGADATVAEVTRRVQGARWWVFNGHGELSEEGSRLRLADGPLHPTDLLLAGGASCYVFLLGCETAHRNPISGRPSLADTLLAAGSRVVVGAHGRLSDATAEALVSDWALEKRLPTQPSDLEAAAPHSTPALDWYGTPGLSRSAK